MSLPRGYWSSEFTSVSTLVYRACKPGPSVVFELSR